MVQHSFLPISYIDLNFTFLVVSDVKYRIRVKEILDPLVIWIEGFNELRHSIEFRIELGIDKGDVGVIRGFRGLPVD